MFKAIQTFTQIQLPVKAKLFILFISVLSLNAAVTPTSVITDATTNHLLRPTNFFTTNIHAGANIQIDRTNSTEIVITASVGAGSGESNWVSHIGDTNAVDRFSLWHSKVSFTNYLVTLSAGAGVVITNQVTNLVFATTGATGEANYNGLADSATNTTDTFGLIYGKLGLTNLLINLIEGDGEIDLSLANDSNLQFSAASTLARDSEVLTATNNNFFISIYKFNGVAKIIKLINEFVLIR